ncbi:tail fiber domain-containing protein [Salmonella enterica]|nr:tail fiber domain-containing protein [Salmonella enterica]EAO0118519.1 tail fiber domain-containing protein [Salmonella enterica]EAO3601624.1 tail fiber domain-containing protein [Salmonella enterica]EAR6391517.1 tail fiber domain-containing protein [Salmonella enterica]EAV1285281.1 tail fiber domain-containing protein [Salmonella enterica]
MPPIDDRTKRFDLELPAQPNTLKNDVERLRKSFSTLAEKAAEIDPATNLLLEDHLPKDIPRLGADKTIDPKYVNPKAVAVLDAQGKIAYDAVPDDAKMNIFDAPTEIMMLDLAATIGDVCNITTPPYRQYLLVKTNPKNRDSWREIPQQAINTINGNEIPKDGAVVVANLENVDATTGKGTNSNITNLTGLEGGPLVLGGKGTQGYEAVTYDQLVGAMGTSGGASMTGVMNNFIGAVEWFNGDRAALPSGYIAADGQLFSRTDPKVSDLWTAVSKGMFVNIDDVSWLNAAGIKSLHRSKYSTGDGSTTFRVPDLNGMQPDSLNRVFLCGSNGKSTDWAVDAPVGIVVPQSAPNITGSTAPIYWEGNAAARSSGAFVGSAGLMNIERSGTQMVMGQASVDFDASKSSNTYGRLGGVLAPNHAGGIWIIRASGAFQAANTEFGVYNSLTTATLPAIGTQLEGGKVKSSLGLDGIDSTHEQCACSLQVLKTMGGTTSIGRLAVYSKGDSAANPDRLSFFNFTSDGRMMTPGMIQCVGTLELTGNTYPSILFNGVNGKRLGSIYGENAGDVTIASGGDAPKYFIHGVDGKLTVPNTITGGGRLDVQEDITTRGLVYSNGTPLSSDRDLKENIQPITDAITKLSAISGYTYNFKDGGAESAGVIAQELKDVLPNVVKPNKEGHLTVEYSGVVALLVEAVKTLSARVAELEAKTK